MNTSLSSIARQYAAATIAVIGSATLLHAQTATPNFIADFNNNSANLTATAANSANLTGSLLTSGNGSASIGTTGFTNSAGIQGNALTVSPGTGYAGAGYSYNFSQLGFDGSNGLGTNSMWAVIKPAVALTGSAYQVFWSTGGGTNSTTNDRILLSIRGQNAVAVSKPTLGFNSVGSGNVVSDFTGASSWDTSKWYFVAMSWTDNSTNALSVNYYLRELNASSPASTTAYTSTASGTGGGTLSANTTDVGLRSDSPSSAPFNGTIDTVTGFNGVALSNTDFRAQYYNVVAPNMSWSNAGNSTNLGGTGTWNSTDTTKWFVSTENTQWVTTAGAVFAGTAGTVTVNGTQTVGRGLTFSTTGYTLTGGNITLNGSNATLNTITTDTSVSATIDSVLSGSNGLTKAGNGTLTLSGTNTYAGTTTVSTGTLLINGDQTSATGLVSVSASAILGGNGTIGGAVTVADNGILAPGTTGDTTTTLTLNNKNLTISGVDSKINLDITGTAAGAFDKISGIAAFAQGGDITFTLSGSYTNGDSWNVFSSASRSGNFDTIALAGSYTGNLTRSGSLWTNTNIGGQSWKFDETLGTLSVVPEPATWALLAFSLTTVMVLRRRRNV